MLCNILLANRLDGNRYQLSPDSFHVITGTTTSINPNTAVISSEAN